MRTLNLFKMLLGCLAVCCFISCSDDDDEFDTSALKGIWAVTKPVLPDDYVTTYTFGPGNTCSIYTGSPLSNGVPTECIYEINKEGTYITFVCKDRNYTEHYHILKRTSDRMEWKNATPEDGNSDKQLKKLKE